MMIFIYVHRTRASPATNDLDLALALMNAMISRSLPASDRYHTLAHCDTHCAEKKKKVELQRSMRAA